MGISKTSLHPCLFCKLEEEKAVLQAQKREAQQEKLTIRDELVRLEQDRLELDAARIALQQSLQDVELSQVGVDAELQSLREEKVKLQERVTQVQKRSQHSTRKQGERILWLIPHWFWVYFGSFAVKCPLWDQS